MAVHPGSIWINQNFNNVPRGLWIAVDGRRLVAEDRSYSNLLNYLKNSNISLDAVTITLLPIDIFQ